MHGLYNLLIIIIACLSLISPLKAKINFKGEKIGIPSVLIVPAGYGYIFGLKKDNTVFQLNISTNHIKKLPGNFKKIQSTKGVVYALSFTNEIYQYNGSIWVKLPLKYYVNDFELNPKEIFFRRSNGVWYAQSLIPNGQTKTLPFPKETAFQYLNRLPDKSYLALDNKNNLLKIDRKKRSIISSDVSSVLHLKNNTIIYSLLNKDIFIKIGSQKPIKASVKNTTYHSVGLLSSNKFFAARNNAVIKSNISLEKSAGFLDNFDIRPRKTNNTASALYSGNGVLFIKSLTGNFFIRRNNKYKLIPGKPLDIAVGNIDNIYTRDAFGNVLHIEGKKNRPLKVSAIDLSVRDNQVLLINHKKELLRYNRSTRSFVKLGKKADEVFLEDTNTYWLTLKNGKVQRCQAGLCKTINKKIIKFTNSPLGLLLALDDKGTIHTWKDRKFKKINIGKKQVRDIAFESDDQLWILDKDYKIVNIKLKFLKGDIGSHNINKKEFERKVKTLSFVTKFKPKRYFVNGNLLSSSQAKLTAASPNIIMKSRSLKKLKTKEVDEKAYLFDISMGRDGVLWAISNSNVFQYSEKKKVILRYNASNFKDKRQKFLGLPSNVTASSIMSDKEGKIWVVERNSKKVFYQKSKKGKFFSVTLNSKSNITDITIDNSGNVYLAATEVFRFDYHKDKFRKLKLPNFNFKRITSGVRGSLWLVNLKGELFELLGGKIYQRNNLSNFIAQDVDMSILGEVYVTSDTHKTRANEPGNNVTATPLADLRCNLERYNPTRKKLEKTGKNTSGKSQYVAVSYDGTPWITCSPSGSNLIFRAE